MPNREKAILRAIRGLRRRLGRAPAPGRDPDGSRYDPRAFETLARLRAWHADDVVLDIGANDGRTVLRLARHLPKLPRVYAYEPTSGAFRRLCERTAKLPRVEAVRQAVGARAGQVEIYVNPQSALSSLDPAWGEAGARETVVMTTVDEIVRAHGLERVHFLKIDVEGHDLEVLKGAHRTLSDGRVEIVQVEVGFGQPGRDQPSLETIRLFLQPYGLFLRQLNNQCHAPLPAEALAPGADPADAPQVLGYADALFVRAPAAVRPAQGGPRRADAPGSAAGGAEAPSGAGGLPIPSGRG
jgi:FkbM family methyltransferase